MAVITGSRALTLGAPGLARVSHGRPRQAGTPLCTQAAGRLLAVERGQPCSQLPARRGSWFPVARCVHGLPAHSAALPAWLGAPQAHFCPPFPAGVTTFTTLHAFVRKHENPAVPAKPHLCKHKHQGKDGTDQAVIRCTLALGLCWGAGLASSNLWGHFRQLSREQAQVKPSVHLCERQAHVAAARTPGPPSAGRGSQSPPACWAPAERSVSRVRLPREPAHSFAHRRCLQLSESDRG